MDCSKAAAAGADPLAIDGIDYIELYVANARQAAFFYCQAFGFTPIAYRGPETGFREAASYVVRQKKATFILTSALRAGHPIAQQVMLHGDSVLDVAFTVDSCEQFYLEAVRRGARGVAVPTLYEDEHGPLKHASIAIYGHNVHSIVERKNYKGVFWPGFVPYEDIFPKHTFPGDVGIVAIDHVVGNVELGAMNTWVKFYQDVLGFKEMLHFSDKDISTEYSALMSKVMRNGTGKVKFPINEPAVGKRKSQIDEYLDFHNGPGVQHVALITGDILKTVSALRNRGVQFLKVPKTYYDEVPKRVGTIKQDLAIIADLGILVDRDDDGYLLQLFTKPVHDRPTLFFEVIQREGSQGFGAGNFKALFEAIEREQAERGNL
ncbi:MAG: 4-hydroxyphenylpyruvate dioxygenase [Deltaproteobacteria bacterium]|nr:4-hydroxyphenylpyruvate dioxygenase [Deltaproteobacteria bacterium]